MWCLFWIAVYCLTLIFSIGQLSDSVSHVQEVIVFVLGIIIGSIYGKRWWSNLYDENGLLKKEYRGFKGAKKRFRIACKALSKSVRNDFQSIDDPI